MEKKHWIWLIVILAFCILTVWTLIVMVKYSSQRFPDGPPGVVITEDGDSLPDGDNAESEINAVIEDTIVPEQDDLDLGEVI